MRRRRFITVASFVIAFIAMAAGGVAAFLHTYPNYLSFHTCSPMLEAVLANDPAKIRRLAAAREPLETRFSKWHKSNFEQNATPLLLAALHGHQEATIALIELGADVNAVNDFGHSVPRFLIEHDDDVALAMVLERGVDAQEFGGSGEQLLTMRMYAESTGSQRCEKVLEEFRRLQSR